MPASARQDCRVEKRPGTSRRRSSASSGTDHKQTHSTTSRAPPPSCRDANQSPYALQPASNNPFHSANTDQHRVLRPVKERRFLGTPEVLLCLAQQLCKELTHPWRAGRSSSLCFPSLHIKFIFLPSPVTHCRTIQPDSSLTAFPHYSSTVSSSGYSHEYRQ